MIKRNRPVDTLGNKNNKQLYNNSFSSQRTRILKHFERSYTLSTIEARTNLGIMHPGSRIMELRRYGHIILTNWIKALDSNGVMHRIVLYSYHGQAKENYYE